MNKFDIHSAKFIGIILLICFIFIMVIWNAFNYLPKKETENSYMQNEIVVPSDEEVREEQPADEVSEEPVEEENNVAEDTYKEPEYDRQMRELEKAKKQAAENSRTEELQPLEPVDEAQLEKDVQLKNQTSAEAQPEIDPLEDALNKAKDFRLNHKPISAINEYQRAISLTNDTAIKAQCYENIAIIYATAKRYGSALSAAQKAYNTAPTVSREVLLARLYYKTGDVEKATNRVNNVLKREFSQEW